MAGSFKKMLVAAGIVGAMATGALVTGLAVAVTAEETVPTGAEASPEASADLAVSQVASDGSGSGHTKVTVSVKNLSANAAANPVVTMLLSTTSTGIGVVPVSSNLASTQCPTQLAPAGWQVMYTCRSSTSIPGNGTWTLVLDLSGNVGKAFKQFASAGTSSGETSMANNATTLSSYYGPAAELAVSQTTLVSFGSGKRTIRASTTNNGPSTANALQLVVEIKAPNFSTATASSNLPTSCQFIPPASGFNAALSCVTNTVGPGVTWMVTFNNTGAPGTALRYVSQVTASNPADPITTNNSATTNTTFTP